jgi:hypothetical protein
MRALKPSLRITPGMRLLPLLTLALFALSASAPFATADQDIQQGPASVRTANYDTGNGCGGGNGSHQRYAEATVETYPGEKVGVWYSQYCSDTTYDEGEYHHNGGWVQVGRTVDNNAGPNVNVNWFDARERWGEYEWHMCYTSVYLSGVGLNIGCLPAGARWPLAPTLP